MYCTNCGSPVSPGDRFCTNCGADLRAQEVASTELESPVREQQDSAASTPDVPSSVSGTVAPAMAEAKPRRHDLVIGLSVASAVVLVIAVVLSLMATHVVRNPLEKPRLVTFSIRAPHYNENVDSRIPLHITGKTTSGKAVSQHVYVSPKAPSVKLDPGQYTIQVEASPLLSSGDVYRLPQPIKIDTTKNANFAGESTPIKQQLKFEIKADDEVTTEEWQTIIAFAKRAKAPVGKILLDQQRIVRPQVAQAFNNVLDMLSTTKSQATSDQASDKAQYSLLDIDQDGVPELLTWFGVNANAHPSAKGPIGCGEEHNDFSGNRMWKYDSKKKVAICLAGEDLPVQASVGDKEVSYKFYPEHKLIAVTQWADIETVRIEGHHLKIQYTGMGADHWTEDGRGTDLDRDWKDGIIRSVFTDITDRELLSLYAMKPSNTSEIQGIDNYDKHAFTISNEVMNGGQVLVGTVELMTPQQVQEYQHQYVVEHQLEANLDPLSTDHDVDLCRDFDNDNVCGNPASVFKNGAILPVFIPEEQRTLTYTQLSNSEADPQYLYRILKYQGKYNATEDDEGASSELLAALKKYAGKRVMVSSDTGWNHRIQPLLPWKQEDVSIEKVLAVLPDSSSQTK